MEVIWLFAGIITCYLAQWFYKWQKPYKLPWYTWVVTVAAYGAVWLTIAVIITLAKQVADWGAKPVLIAGLGTAVIAIILGGAARLLVASRMKKAGKASAAA